MQMLDCISDKEGGLRLRVDARIECTQDTTISAYPIFATAAFCVASFLAVTPVLIFYMLRQKRRLGKTIKKGTPEKKLHLQRCGCAQISCRIPALLFLLRVF